MTAHPDDEMRRRESDAILKRLRQETEPQVGTAGEGIARGPIRHFGAGDVDQDDRIEVLGTRIGRLAGLGAFIVLLVIFVLDHLVA